MPKYDLFKTERIEVPAENASQITWKDGKLGLNTLAFPLSTTGEVIEIQEHLLKACEYKHSQVTFIQDVFEDTFHEPVNPMYFDQDFAKDLYVHAHHYVKPPEPPKDPNHKGTPEEFKDDKYIPPKERLHLFLDAEMVKIVIPSIRRIFNRGRTCWEVPYDFSRFAKHKH